VVELRAIRAAAERLGDTLEALLGAEDAAGQLRQHVAVVVAELAAGTDEALHINLAAIEALQQRIIEAAGAIDAFTPAAATRLIEDARRALASQNPAAAAPAAASTTPMPTAESIAETTEALKLDDAAKKLRALKREKKEREATGTPPRPGLVADLEEAKT